LSSNQKTHNESQAAAKQQRLEQKPQAAQDTVIDMRTFEQSEFQAKHLEDEIAAPAGE